MPMLHGCAFPGCTTLTLSTYCVEHELFVRALKESERTRAVPDAGRRSGPAFETAAENVEQERAPI
jgi:hypothetical protein